MAMSLALPSIIVHVAAARWKVKPKVNTRANQVIPFLAFCVTRQQPEIDRPLKPPSKNWARAFEKRYLETQARRVKALD
ncbi:uncharacterized protein BDZ99DRAFT_466631 [Mytilinidion resinicola]|uniref:Uncharacterized protein n=1 Tax=Mytilinidion resinicola TaxID=574789 RepID=A0A6A6YAU0_9PEZI|nr:uncharacterized protein BDZ99DRAFT_466631 [Mytilinidion resinicola]KAF2805688.1 hypothetical protein BDZ99DRAFT_466631 [Mytilinidion resinicola]